MPRRWGRSSPLIVAFAVTPALVVVWPDRTVSAERRWFDFAQWGRWVARRRAPLLAASLILTIVAGIGLTRLAPHIDPVDFLQKSNPVAMDLRPRQRTPDQHRIGPKSSSTTGLEERPFVEKMLQVRRIQEKIDAHPAVRHSFSVASLFPDPIARTTCSARRNVFQSAGPGKRQRIPGAESATVANHHRVGRDWKSNAVCNALQEQLADEPVTLTGVSP